MSEQEETQLVERPPTGILQTITGINNVLLTRCTPNCPVCNHRDVEHINWLYITRQAGICDLQERFSFKHPNTIYRHLIRTGLYAWLHSRDGLRLALSGIVNRGSRAQPRAADAVAAAKIILQLDGHLRDNQQGASARELVDELRRLDNSAWDAIERDAEEVRVMSDEERVKSEGQQAADDAKDPGIFE